MGDRPAARCYHRHSNWRNSEFAFSPFILSTIALLLDHQSNIRNHMLVKNHCAQKLLATPVRHYATSSYKSITKLRGSYLVLHETVALSLERVAAFRFRLSPEAAKLEMASHAAMLTRAGRFTNLITLISSLVPLGIFLRPTRMVATYFPAWLISGEVEVDITYKSAKVRDHFALAGGDPS